MKKGKSIITLFVLFSITLAITPPAIPQVGTYTFLGAPGNIKILKVNVVNNQSLEDLFGAGWVSVIEVFGSGAANVGARSKSLVTAVNFSAKFDASTEVFPVFGLPLYDIALYNTSNWDWTTEPFSDTPDSVGGIVRSFYDPTNLTTYINAFYTTYFLIPYNISLHTAGAYFAQLPINVEQYLGAFIWEPKWENIGNTIVHHAEAGDFNVPLYTFQYLENCTEIWTYDTTYGAWIGYKIIDDANNVIYQFSIELSVGIPGYEIPVIIGIVGTGIISLIYVVMKKKR
ncbi:MAG: hypothetical protein ACFFE5_07785 [Candidatus Thorarchaeota archaeon]